MEPLLTALSRDLSNRGWEDYQGMFSAADEVISAGASWLLRGTMHQLMASHQQSCTQSQGWGPLWQHSEAPTSQIAASQATTFKIFVGF